MHQQFMAAVRQLCNEKNLPEDVIMDIVKAALGTAYRKDYGNKDQNIEVEIDPKTENVTIYIVKKVVDKIVEADLEMTLEDARKLNKTITLDQEIRMEVTPMSYGRIAAQAAKQVIIQRIQEAERDFMFEAFKDRENELVNAQIHRVDGNQVFVEMGGVTALLPAREQISSEQYYGGQRIKLYLDRVVKTPKGPQLLISRTHPKLVEKLMELEIPEVKTGIVIIKGVAREPGVRCKVAVASKDPQVDPIGACVGQNGVRVQAVTHELAGERIDIIPWNEDAQKFIMESLKPAKISRVEVDNKIHLAKVYVTQDQRALAIGKSGQNVRLASQLTGWEIDILDTDVAPGAAAAEVVERKILMVSDLDLPDDVKEKLTSVSLEQVAQLMGLSVKDFMQVDGITKEEATQIVQAVAKNK